MFQISLAAARVNAGFKQKEAAVEVGVSEKTLGSYERGQTAIPAHILKKVSKLYGIPADNIRLPILSDGHFDADEKNLNHTTF